MKTLVLANQKGGVGKSAIAVQYAYYEADIRKKRVLLIDFDHQRNSSKAMRVGGMANIANITSSQLFTESDLDIAGAWDETASLVAVTGDDDLMKNGRAVEFSQEVLPVINAFASNLKNFLESVSDKFDLCVIDVNPNPDIRQLAALICSDFVLAPVQLNQEAIDGIGDLLNHDEVGIRRIQQILNQNLVFIGILPNLVEATPFQKNNLAALVEGFGSMLVKTSTGYGFIKKTTAIPEAQAEGLPVWKLGKTSAREAWAQMKPTFDKISQTMEG